MAKRARDPVQFTLESAERIARVVRDAETAPPQAAPLTFAKQFPVRVPEQIKFAYYTATSDWRTWWYHGPTDTNNTKQIMFVSGDVATTDAQALTAYYATGATAMCFNNFQYLPLISTNATAAKMMVIAMKSGGIWRLVGAAS